MMPTMTSMMPKTSAMTSRLHNGDDADDDSMTTKTTMTAITTMMVMKFDNDREINDHDRDCCDGDSDEKVRVTAKMVVVSHHW